MEGDSAAWIFRKDYIDSLQPSKHAKKYRSKTVWFLQDIGKSLRFDQVVKATAAVFFHRFYLFHSFEQHDRFLVALACLFLASKAEERAVRVKDLALAYFNLVPKVIPEGREATEREIDACCKEIILKERILLHTLNFEVGLVIHPYEFCQKKVIEMKNYIQHDIKEFLASMYSIINDSYRTTLCLQYLPNQIAMAAFYIASIQLSIKPMHSSNRSGFDKTWLDLLEPDIDPNLLHEISLEILALYDQSTHIISDHSRILSSILGSNIHTVSTSNTPNFTAHNPLVEKEAECSLLVLEKQVSITKENNAIVRIESANSSALKLSVCPPGSVSPQSVHPPLDGSESTFSTIAGFSALATPRQPYPDSTPSWTPRCDDWSKVRRDRSNSFNEYTTVEPKRHRSEF